MTKGTRNITRSPLGRTESRLLTAVAHSSTFSIDDARTVLAPRQRPSARQILERLRAKGWIERVKRGWFAVIPLSSGATRSTHIHEFVVAMNLVRPAAIAYFSALNHHGLTEQLPRTVFVATDHPVRKRDVQSLGFSFKVVSVRKEKYFGVEKGWIGEQSFMITNREKTLVDALDLPGNAGGVGLVVAAIRSHWGEFDEPKLFEYARRLGNSAVAKRLGFIMETLGVGNPEALRTAVKLGSGYPRLDPTLPARGQHNRRWGLLVNAKVAP